MFCFISLFSHCYFFVFLWRENLHFLLLVFRCSPCVCFMYFFLWCNEVRVMDWMSSPQNLHVESLTPSVMVFGDESFGKELGLHEVMRVVFSWWDGIKDFIWRDNRYRNFAHSETGKPGDTPPDHEGSLILDFQPPELWENKFPLLKAQSLWCLVMAAWAN